MGFIPLFLTVGGACLLFFMTVRNTMMRKINLQKELFFKLGQEHPEFVLTSGSLLDLNRLIENWKSHSINNPISATSLEIIRELKVNRLQYNALIKKAPYNWVAKISGFQAI